MTTIIEALTFDDVLLVPAYSEVLPQNTDIRTHLTRKIKINIPIVSAAMDTVTEARLAITMAEEGGIGILHKNMGIAEQAQQVTTVKNFESGIVKNPVTVTPDTTIKELFALKANRKFSGFPVVSNGCLQGIITNRDVRFETNLDQPVAKLMTPRERLITIHEKASKAEAIALLHQNRIEKILVVNNKMQLRGMITVKDILKAKEKPQACRDEHGQLRVGAAVGTAPDTAERMAALVAAGVDVLVIDTAHGHSKKVFEQLRFAKKHYPDLQVMVGNIATVTAAKELVRAGADAIKVGIGPGSICTTRIVAGVGVPQLSAVLEIAQALKKSGVPIIADGGIRYSGDIAKVLAAGAWSVMIGSLFAGAEEAPGEIELYQGRSYKSYRGMGSIGAMAQSHGSADRYFQEIQTDFGKLVPEGIEGRVPYKGNLAMIIYQMLGGLRSAMGYTGCESLTKLRNYGKFRRITDAGVRESHVHDVVITKEAPNYRAKDTNH